MMPEVMASGGVLGFTHLGVIRALVEAEIPIDVVGGVSYFSTAGNAAIAGVAGPYDNADIYKIDPVLGCIRVFDASTTGLVDDIDVDIDGLTVVDDDTFQMGSDDGGS